MTQHDHPEPASVADEIFSQLVRDHGHHRRATGNPDVAMMLASSTQLARLWGMVGHIKGRSHEEMLAYVRETGDLAAARQAEPPDQPQWRPPSLAEELEAANVALHGLREFVAENAADRLVERAASDLSVEQLRFLRRVVRGIVPALGFMIGLSISFGPLWVGWAVLAWSVALALVCVPAGRRVWRKSTEYDRARLVTAPEARRQLQRIAARTAERRRSA